MNKKNQIQIWSRGDKISSSFIDNNIFIHNGKEFKRLFVRREHVGFKFGEFSSTKKHTKKIKKKKK